MIRELTIVTGLILALCVSITVQAQDSEPEIQFPDLEGNFSESAVNLMLAPRVFTGYRNMNRPRKYTQFPDAKMLARAWSDNKYLPEECDTLQCDSLVVETRYRTPEWLKTSMNAKRFQEDFVYMLMIEDPGYIEYAYWDLPERPQLPEEDTSLRGYLNRLDIPEIAGPTELAIEPELHRINWLHTVNASLQLSQAYVSANWYQGGTSYFALLANFLWDVQLNPVYHPNMMFQSTLSYKLAINSTPDDLYHKYSIAQDLFQYNLKAGYKAVKHWYYSFSLQYKTQFFNSYPANSMVRSASFLSPGELNVGLGMTYTKENAAKTVKFSATVAPIAYNMRTCIDPEVDHALISFPTDKKIVHEYGSTADINFSATFWKNATYTTHMFLFTDYKNFQGDWEHTLNFQFSKLFSTQIYVHMRYDTAADQNIARKWRKFMLREVLSFGLSYNFSTK